jgi:hypothetical protein
VNAALAISGALGGFVAFGLAVATIVRAIARMVSATTDNTAALSELSKKLEGLDNRVDQQGERIARLEGGIRP